MLHCRFKRTEFGFCSDLHRFGEQDGAFIHLGFGSDLLLSRHRQEAGSGIGLGTPFIRLPTVD